MIVSNSAATARISVVGGSTSECQNASVLENRNANSSGKCIHIIGSRSCRLKSIKTASFVSRGSATDPSVPTTGVQPAALTSFCCTRHQSSSMHQHNQGFSTPLSAAFHSSAASKTCGRDSFGNTRQFPVPMIPSFDDRAHDIISGSRCGLRRRSICPRVPEHETDKPISPFVIEEISEKRSNNQDCSRRDEARGENHRLCIVGARAPGRARDHRYASEKEH